MKKAKYCFLALALFSLKSYAGLCRPDIFLHCAPIDSHSKSFARFQKVLKTERQNVSSKISSWRTLAQSCPDELKKFKKEEKKLKSSPFPVPKPLKPLPSCAHHIPFSCAMFALNAEKFSFLTI